jgi:hypothetical protein
MKKTLSLAGLAVVLCVRGAAADEAPDSVRLKVADGHVDFLVGGELAGRYHYQDELSKAKPIFWPLYAPGEVPVTRAWPMQPAGPGGSTDHPHQKSAWFCHGDVIPEGLALRDKIKGVEGVDFWSEAKGHGRIVCVSVGEPRWKKGKAWLVTKNEWQTADGTKILDEQRILSLHAVGKGRLLVLDIDLHAGAYPISFGDTKEGSMGVRVHDELREQRGTGKLTNAQGATREREVWGRQSDWCDYSGTVGGKPAGITLFDDSQNASRACWHSRGYGLMAANPFGRAASGFPAVRGKKDLVRLAKGEHLRLRYGILLHAGDADSGEVAACYRRFVELRDAK